MSYSNYDDEITGQQVVKWGLIGLIALILILVGGTVIGLGYWQLGWWQQGINVNRQAHITQQGYSNQVTMEQQVQAKVQDIDAETTQIADPANAAEVGALKAQRAAEGNQACSDYAQLTPTFRKSSGESSWAAANCNGGILSISSPLYVKG